MNTLMGIRAGLAAIGGFIGWFLGGLDGLVYALIAFIIVDFLAGVRRGVMENELSSRIGARGIFKKIRVMLLVGIANIIDIYLIQSGNSPLRTAVIFFYISNEGLSILENASALGLPVPQKIKDVLAQLRKKGDAE
jgi:toxin secretion/phage lysis holin